MLLHEGWLFFISVFCIVLFLCFVDRSATFAAKHAKYNPNLYRKLVQFNNSPTTQPNQYMAWWNTQPNQDSYQINNNTELHNKLYRLISGHIELN